MFGRRSLQGWTRYHRLLQPGQHLEPVSTRPRLLSGASRQINLFGQRRMDVRLSHAEAPRLSERIIIVIHFLCRNGSTT
jgi:hypothetical protein